jgi:hypothetical protein
LQEEGRLVPFFSIAALAAAGSIGGALISGNAADNAAQTQANAANNASAVQQHMYDDTVAREQPFVGAGTNALAQLLKGLGLSPGADGTPGTGVGSLNKPFSLSDFTSSPGYQFQQQQGMDAILNRQSAIGGVSGGNTLKALLQYSQGLASQDFYNAQNVYQGQQNQQFNQLQTLAGSGQNAAANLGALGSQTAGQIGNNITGAGNAISAGQIAGGNALGGALGGIGNNFLLAQLLQGGGASGGLGSGVPLGSNGIFGSDSAISI